MLRIPEKHDSAVYFMKKSIPKQPTSIERVIDVGMFYDFLDQPQQAKLYYLEALKKQPDYIRALSGLSTLYRLNQEYADALKQAEYLNKISVKQGSIELALTYFYKVIISSLWL